jgi:predicted CxxxxCH...CXXCH cytochrome family protein
MQSTTSPMPPASFNRPPTAAEISAMQAWINGGYQGSCSDGGAPPPQNLTCTSCHGDANRTGIAGADANLKSAPPVGTKGETAATTRAVGAHQAHLNKADFAASPLKCNECHVVPTATNHSNNVVEMAFGTLARTGNVTPAWNATAMTCTASYCHGNFTGGNTTAAPTWTGAAMMCTSCHAAPPATDDHRRSQHVGLPCSDCHGTGYSATTVNKALHLNGQKNAGGAGSMITTYNAATGACTPTCHGTKTW